MSSLDAPPARLPKTALFLTVFTTGAAVMLIELLGTRLIAPFYGASLYVWSSLISVTMIALATGYYVGGWWADRARRTGLALVISLAALLTLLIPWLTRPVLLATDGLGLRGGAFVSALVLFFPSLTLLGMVSPFAIKLATRQLDGVGFQAGSIYAVSTIGSVIGTLTLGFYLFPVVGSREILAGLGGLLLTLGLVVSFLENRPNPTVKAWPSLLLTLISLGLLPLTLDSAKVAAGTGKFVVRSAQESLYGWVRVVDFVDQDLRTMMSDASTIGAATISTEQNGLAYQGIVNLFPALAPHIRKALLIGQGAGHMASTLRDRYQIVTDTLEIDPAVADAASRYFGFKPSGRAIVGDARYEIRHLQGSYDLIIMDCFTGGTEPSHLLTLETLKHLRSLLDGDGLLALNFVAFADGGRNPGLASVARTLTEVFPHQSVFISEPGDDFNDFIFLAGSKPVDLAVPTLSPAQSDWLRTRQFSVDQSQGMVLTDNFNPLEHLQIRKSEHYRAVMVDWYGKDMLVR